MSKVLIIGCGGVASVAIHKCCQVPEVFTDICIASRTKSKCDKLAAELAPKTTTNITTAQVDADHVDEVIALIKSYQPDLVMNIALPYQDLTIMDACLACGVNYMDTANYEPENTDDPAWRAIYEKRCKEAGFSAYFDYSWQWAYAKKFEEAGLTALLGSGFDPGVTQAYCAYAKKHEFDTIDTIDILDCNGGDHGYAFATEFDKEVENLVNNFLGSCTGTVDFVKNNKRLFAEAECLFKNKSCLRHTTLKCVNKQYNTVNHLENTLNLTAEIGMTGGVNNVNFDAVVHYGCRL